MEGDALNVLEEHLATYGPGPSPHIVAYSGGVDSAVLLDLMASLASRHGLVLEAVTVDHGLRDFTREAAVTAQVCETLGVPHRILPLAPGILARSRSHGQSLMERTREERYQALLEAVSGGTLYLAHHADDQAETLLMRLLRGSGLKGLAGMREESGSLRRPLLTLPRAALAAYAVSRELTVVEDPSNQNTRFVRNHLRHRVMPVLPTDTGNPTMALARSAGLLADQADVMDGLLEALMTRHVQVHEPHWAMTGWGELAPLVRKALVHRLLSQVTGRPACNSHAKAVNQMLASTHGTASLDLGAGIVARREYDVLIVGPRCSTDCPQPVFLGAESSLVWGSWSVSLTHQRAPTGFMLTSRDEAWFGDHLAWPLTIRGWCLGDKIAPHGMAGTRLLSDLLGEAGIARGRRDSWPVVADANENVLWVPGVRRSGHALAVAGEMAWRLTCYGDVASSPA